MWEDDVTLSALSSSSENNMAAVHEYEQSADAGDAEVKPGVRDCELVQMRWHSSRIHKVQAQSRYNLKSHVCPYRLH